MAFNQRKLDKVYNQSRGIFDRWIYRSDTDSIAEITSAGYFNASRFADEPDWKDNPVFIDVLAVDGPYDVQLVGGVASVVNSDGSISVSTQQGLEDAINAERPINFVGNPTITITSPLSFTNKSVKITGAANIIIDYSDNPSGFTPLTLKSSFLLPVTVSALSDVNYDFGNGNTYVTRLTVSDSSGYSVGDPVRILSQDQVPWLDPADSQKMGSDHIVGAIDSGNNYIYLLDKVYFSFATSITLVKFDASKSLYIGGDVNFSKSGVMTGSTREATVSVIGYHSPFVANASADGLYGEFVSFIGCMAHKTLGVKGRNLITDTANEQYGYVVVERSSSYGMHLDLEGENVRHVYTNGAVFNPSVTEYEGYGLSAFGTVNGCIGRNCTASAIDTHPESYYTTISECKALYPNAGSGGVKWGIQLRGTGDKAADCEISGGDGIVIRQEYGSTDLTKDVFVSNIRYIGKIGESITAPFRVEGASGAGILNCVIENSRVIYSEPLYLLEAVNADVSFENVKANCKFVSGATVGPFYLDNSSVTVFGGSVDYEGSTVSNTRHSILNDDNSVFVCKGNHEVVSGTTDWAVITDFTGNSGKSYYYDFYCDEAPEFPNPSVNRGGGAIFRWTHFVNNGQTKGSNYVELTKTANFSLSGNRIEEQTADEIYVICDISGGAGTIQVTGVPLGFRAGQRLHVINKTGANSLQINASVNIERTTNVTLADGESHTFVCSDTGTWYG